jgi:hypothetical protein
VERCNAFSAGTTAIIRIGNPAWPRNDGVGVPYRLNAAWRSGPVTFEMSGGQPSTLREPMESGGQ